MDQRGGGHQDVASAITQRQFGHRLAIGIAENVWLCAACQEAFNFHSERGWKIVESQREGTPAIRYRDLELRPSRNGSDGGVPELACVAIKAARISYQAIVLHL